MIAEAARLSMALIAVEAKLINSLRAMNSIPI